VIQISPTEKFTIFNFFVPVRPDRRYAMSFSDVNAKEIASESIQSRDRFGNFSVVCPRELFTEGTYKLQVQELDKETDRGYDEYIFQFKITLI
jgi:hypothetical protein